MTTTLPVDRSWRRFFRFRLRTLLLAMLVIAVPLSWKVNQVRRQRAAVAAIERLGDSVVWAWDKNHPPGPAWLCRLLGEDFLSHVEGVVGTPGPNDKEIIRYAAKFPRLNSILFTDADGSITDEDLELLRDCSELGHVTLDCPKLTGRGVAIFADKTELRSLSLHCEEINDDDLRHLARLTELRELSLCGANVHGPGLTWLSELKHLETLNLTRTRCTDEALNSLVLLPALTHLYLSDTEVSDAGLAHIDKMVNLQDLFLERTQVTDMGLASLSQLKNLNHISLSGSKATYAGADQLCGRLPNLWTINLLGKADPVGRRERPQVR